MTSGSRPALGASHADQGEVVTENNCECVMRGMTGGKAHPLCPVHGHLHEGESRYGGVPADAKIDEQLRAEVEALTGRARQHYQQTPESFTRLTLSVSGAGHHMAGHVTVLCCDDCGSLVGNTVAHRLLCFREERDSPQTVTYMEALLEGADPDEGFYE